MDWLNAAALFVIFAGHCELMAAWINRVHALPLRRTVLKATRCLHDLLVVGFLPLVLWRIGFSGPGLLRGGEWAALPVPWIVYFACCGLGVASLVKGSAAWLLQRQREVRASRIENVAAELGHPPSGPGLRGRIARLPLNEVFLLEINEKEFVLPRLPAELDGLSIAHLSDVHFRGPVGLDYFRFAFDQIEAMQADLVAFTGDLLDNQELVEWLPETFGRLSAPLGRWFILGNHDWIIDAEPIREAMEALGWHNLGFPLNPTPTGRRWADHGREVTGKAVVIKRNGRAISLAGDERPWMGTFDPERKGKGELSILLSHTPDNFSRAAREGIDLVLSGHNHGGQVCLPLIGPVYSPSRYGIRYSAGIYRRGSTTLHVSRGLSAERPLRWNCPPEVTKLVLRSSPAGQAPA